MESPQYNQREQALANCKFLYGVETEVLTLRCGDRHQALAIRFDSVTESATKLLHTRCHASCTNDAIQYLLQETEIEVAKLFSTNGISIPFPGDLVETMTIRRRVSYARGSTQSEELEFIATPVSSLPETSVTWKENLDENHEVEHEDKGFERHIQDPHKIEEYSLREPTSEFPVDGDLKWAALASKKEKKKKKGVTAVEEPMAVPEPDPDPEVVAEDSLGWGAFAPLKNKKKKKGVTAVEEPMAVPVPEPDPEVVAEDSLGWGTFAPLKNKKKKKGVTAVEEPMAVPVPEPDPEVVAEDSLGWGAFASKKDKKKKMKGTTPAEEPMPVPEPVPEISVDDAHRLSTFFSALGAEKKKSNLTILDPPENKELINEAGEHTIELQPAVEDNGPLHPDSQPELEEADLNIPPEPESLKEKATHITTYHSQMQDERCGHTVVLKILHSSHNIDQPVQLMVTLADNTLTSVYDAVNSYLSSNPQLTYKNGQRKIEVIYGAGKNGDLHLSGLMESKWAEYLEYFAQCTGIPELTVSVQ